MKNFFDEIVDNFSDYLGNSAQPLALFMIPTMVIYTAAFIITAIRAIF